MKLILSIITGAMLGAAALTSCDSVAEDERFIPAEVTPMRAILIEEYTGQNCTNCPDGHKAITQLTSTLGDSIVAVGIHASELAINPPLGLKTATGEEYYKAAGSPALPTAVINLQTAPLQVTDWGSVVDRLIINPTPFTVKAQADLDGEDYNIKVAFSSGDDYEGKLMVWICENDIVRRQIDHGTTISDYVHNHVFRAAVTSDIWGQPVTLKKNEPQYLDFTYKIKASDFWNTDNIYVVAFLYNDGGVAQVTSTHQAH